MKNTEMAVALAAATCTNVQQIMVADTVFDQLPTIQLSRHFKPARVCHISHGNTLRH